MAMIVIVLMLMMTLPVMIISDNSTSLTRRISNYFVPLQWTFFLYYHCNCQFNTTNNCLLHGDRSVSWSCPLPSYLWRDPHWGWSPSCCTFSTYVARSGNGNMRHSFQPWLHPLMQSLSPLSSRKVLLRPWASNSCNHNRGTCESRLTGNKAVALC